MTANPAVLELPPTSSVEDDAGCDYSNAANDAALESKLDRMRREWHEVARYMLTLSRDGDWNDQTIIGDWLPYEEASRLREKLDTQLLIKQGGVRRWASAAYGITLHTPTVTKTNKASVGDLLLHTRVVEQGEFNLTGGFVIRKFLLAAEVTAVTAGGHIVSYRDRDGEHFTAPVHPHVISTSEIDVQGVLATIAAEEKVWGHWAGEFVSPKALEATLVRYQRIQAPKYPAGEER